MNRTAHCIRLRLAMASLVIAAFAATNGARAADNLSEPVRQYLTPIELIEKQRVALKEYASFAPQKAIAVSAAGNFGYSYAGTEPSSGARSALYWCQTYSALPCRVHTINGELFMDEYAEYARRSANAIAKLQIPENRDYNLEGIDWGIPSPSQLRQRKSDPYAKRTPIALSGIRTIKTVELARMLATSKPIMIDAQGWDDVRPGTIPGALLIDWAGTEDAHIPGKEEKVMKRFESVMQHISLDKSTAIVVFSHSTISWVSINAALRLQTLGYHNVLWYRGGKDSWTSAGLPLVPSVPHATIIVRD